MNKFFLSLFAVSSAFLGFFILISGCKKDDDIRKIYFNPALAYGSMTDQDGNTYKTIVIGTQTWMAENLRLNHYRNGDPIPTGQHQHDWSNASMEAIGACCIYNNQSNWVYYDGRLYNWYAVNDSRNIAPLGWHIPSRDEWCQMLTYVDDTTKCYEVNGIPSITATKLAEGRLDYPPEWQTNITGFTAIPGGYRSPSGNYDNPGFYAAGYWACWWTITEAQFQVVYDRAYLFQNGFSDAFFL